MTGFFKILWLSALLFPLTMDQMELNFNTLLALRFIDIFFSILFKNFPVILHINLVWRIWIFKFWRTLYFWNYIFLSCFEKAWCHRKQYSISEPTSGNNITFKVGCVWLWACQGHLWALRCTLAPPPPKKKKAHGYWRSACYQWQQQ